MKRIRAHLEGLLRSEQFTYPALRSMLLTLILDQFCIYIMGVFSTALVSSVGEAAIAAVSMVNTINGLIALVFTALASGGGIVVARAKAGETWWASAVPSAW